MNYSKTLAWIGCVALVGAGSFAQDPLLGKGKGSPPQKSAPPPRQTPPPQKSSPPPRQTPPQKSSPPPRQTPPPRQAPPRETPPPRQAPPRETPPPRHTPPPRENPPLQKGAPPRETPPPRQTPPPREIPPLQKGAPPRNAPPPRETPPTREIPNLRNQPPIQTGNGQDRGGLLGRIDTGRSTVNTGAQRGNDNLLNRRSNEDSRSGRVQYGTVNNQSARNANARTFRTDTSTLIDVRSGSLQFQVLRQENVRYATRYRSGYVHYDPRWCDDYFYYPYYRFTPAYNQCVLSPWYYYPTLPGYLANTRIIIIDSRPCTFVGTYYHWVRPNRYGGDYSYGYGARATALDYALEDLVNGFERSDRRPLSRLVPSRGRVSIALEGRMAYSIDADDFYDMLMDAAFSTETRRYDILDVRTYRDEATVMARHEYIDPWGETRRVYHYLRLVPERGEYVIREFGTSDSRFAY